MAQRTAQRAAPKRAVRKVGGASNTRSTTRQKVRPVGRRDGKPLIFGWGRHLTNQQKQRIQQRALYTFFGVIVVAVLGVFIFGVIQQNVIIPNQTIVSVNNHNIPQDLYRKQLAYNAQDQWNTIQSQLKQQTDLQDKVTANDQDAIKQNTLLTQQLQSEEGNYAQSVITQTTIDQLVNDQFIQQNTPALLTQDPKAHLTPTSQEIDAKLKAFKAAFPKGESYSKFLQKDNLSDRDVRAAIAVTIRHDLAQTYLASQYVSPAKQVHLRLIQTNSKADAQKVLDQLQKSPNDNALWNTLAKQSSLDADSKNTGGDKGWYIQGVNDVVIENWAYDSARKAGDLSGVIKDASGTYDVAQVLDIDPHRAVPADQLKIAQDNALSHWLSVQRDVKLRHSSKANQEMMNASRNLPQTPDLNAQLPNENPQPNTGSSLGG